MSIGDEISDSIFRKKRFDSRLVSTLREPNPSGLATEVLPVVGDSNANLRTFGFRSGNERNEAMSGSASNNLEHTFVLEISKRTNQVPIVAMLPKFPSRTKAIEIHICNGSKFVGLAPGAINFFFSQRNKLFEMLCISFLEERINQHFAKRRRYIHREARSSACFMQVLKDKYKREVNFGDCFVKPILFQKLRVLRVAHERKVRMKDEAKVSCWHRSYVYFPARDVRALNGPLS